MLAGNRCIQRYLIRTTEAGYASTSKTSLGGQHDERRDSTRRPNGEIEANRLLRDPDRESTSSLLGQHPSVSNSMISGSVIPPHTM